MYRMLADPTRKPCNAITIDSIPSSISISRREGIGPITSGGRSRVRLLALWASGRGGEGGRGWGEIGRRTSGGGGVGNGDYVGWWVQRGVSRAVTGGREK